MNFPLHFFFFLVEVSHGKLLKKSLSPLFSQIRYQILFESNHFALHHRPLKPNIMTELVWLFYLVFLYVHFLYFVCCLCFSHSLVYGACARGHAFPGNLGPYSFDDILLFIKDVWS